MFFDRAPFFGVLSYKNCSAGVCEKTHLHKSTFFYLQYKASVACIPQSQAAMETSTILSNGLPWTGILLVAVILVG